MIKNSINKIVEVNNYLYSYKKKMYINYKYFMYKKQKNSIISNTARSKKS